MAAEEMDVRTRIVLLALKWSSGPEKIMAAFKSQLMAVTVAGAAADIQFLVEAAKLLPDPLRAARFLKALKMMKDRVEGSVEKGRKWEGTLGQVMQILEEAEKEARFGFGQKELEEAELVMDVVES